MAVSKKPAARSASDATPATDLWNMVLDRKQMENFLETVTERKRDDALHRAQSLVWDAWERSTARSRIALARKALALSPVCADAISLLADEAKTPEEARDLYARAVEAGELAIGDEGFSEYAGHFWGVLATRPYMRAKSGLAGLQRKLGDEASAIAQYRDLLRLNPGDNQGIRYILAAILLEREDVTALRELLDSYGNEWSVHWLYTNALLAFREGAGREGAGREGAGAGRRAAKLAKEALSNNPHVPDILSGAQPPVVLTDYVAVGEPSDATHYVAEFGAAWRRTPGAIAWLTGIAAASARKARGKSKAPLL